MLVEKFILSPKKVVSFDGQKGIYYESTTQLYNTLDTSATRKSGKYVLF